MSSIPVPAVVLQADELTPFNPDDFPDDVLLVPVPQPMSRGQARELFLIYTELVMGEPVLQ
jgi:hypothetical protein